MEDEAQKRNTDCVYFLASPLTCKKGVNCEYRHSEAARMNPRDCRFWISGTCLNAHCSYRHPPLEGRPVSAPGAPPPASGTPATAGNSIHPAPGASTTVTASAVPSKSKTPCFFFSQGFCAKGDRCPFMHSPFGVTNVDPINQQKPQHVPHPKTAVTNTKPTFGVNGKEFSVQNEPPQTAYTVVNRRLANQIQVSLKTQGPAEGGPRAIPDSERSRMQENIMTSALSKYQNPYESRLPKKVNASDGSRQGMVERPKQVQQGQRWQYQQQFRADHMQVADYTNLNNSRLDKRSAGVEGYGSDGSDNEFSGQSENMQKTRVGNVPTHKSLNDHGQTVSDSTSADQRQGQHRPKCESLVSSARISSREANKTETGHSGAGDLRNHLMKRRRNEPSHHENVENAARRGHPDIREKSSLNKRLREEQQNPRNGADRRLPKRIESQGVKRVQQDDGSSPDSASLRLSNKPPGSRSSPDVKGSSSRPFVRNRLGNDPRDSASHLPSKSIRSADSSKQDTVFAGPKSLAQIKAERKAKEEHVAKPKNSSEQSSKSGHLVSSTSNLRRSNIGSISIAKKGTAAEEVLGDFEGPKPLRLLLQRKRKAEPFSDTHESNLSASELSREIEDGEVRDEEDEVKLPESHESKLEDSLNRSRSLPPAEEELASSPSHDNKEGTSEGGERSQREDIEEDREEDKDEYRDEDIEEDGDEHRDDDRDDDRDEDLQDDMDYSEDGLKLGENGSGDEDYGLDDDDDDENDFAKKLGGFLTMSHE